MGNLTFCSVKNGSVMKCGTIRQLAEEIVKHDPFVENNHSVVVQQDGKKDRYLSDLERSMLANNLFSHKRRILPDTFRWIREMEEIGSIDNDVNQKLIGYRMKKIQEIKALF